MFRARLAALALLAGLSGCCTYHCPPDCGGDPYGFSGFGGFGAGPGLVGGPQCGCNGVGGPGPMPMAGPQGPLLEGGVGQPQMIPPPGGQPQFYGPNGGLSVQPGMLPLQTAPGTRLRPTPLAQPMPSPP